MHALPTANSNVVVMPVTLLVNQMSKSFIHLALRLHIV